MILMRETVYKFWNKVVRDAYGTALIPRALFGVLLFAFIVIGPISVAYAFPIKTGTYTGDGMDNRNIEGIGFQPDYVIVLPNSTAFAVFRPNTLTGDLTLSFDDAPGVALPNKIQSLLVDGFQVGTDISVNAASVTYYYIAMKKQHGEFETGTYTGNGAANRLIPLSFQPNFVMTRSGTTVKDTLGRSSTIANAIDLSFKMSSATVAANYIQALEPGGFRIGSSSNVNATGVTYHYQAWKSTGGTFNVGSYTGNGIDNRNIAGVGFQPEIVLIANSTSGTGRPSIRTDVMSGDASRRLHNVALEADRIQAIQADGFQIGTQPEVNKSAVPYHYMAWRNASPIFTQSAYRLFNNTNGTDVGPSLAAPNTAATLGSSGASFRIRALVHVATASLGISGQNFKLQFVGKGTGTCAAPSGGTPAAYTDLTAATAIAYLDNATPVDGAALTANASDPTHGADIIVNQSYEELNTFTNAQGAISSGQDGKWDFALKDNGALASATFCFRVVKSDGTALNSYTVYPEIVTAPLLLVKQVWLVGGSSPLATSHGTPTTTTVPSGGTVVFLIYVKNSAATAPADIRIQDILDITATGFSYVTGGLIRTSATTPPANTASDLTIFNATALGVGTAMTDAVDGDVASICDSGSAACPGTNRNRVTVGNTSGLTPTQVNATLSIPANSTFAIRFLAVKK